MGAREGGRRVRSPERDGLPCHTQILDQERGEGSLGRTGGLYRGQGGRGKERRDKGNIREKREKGRCLEKGPGKEGGFILMKREE